MLEGLAEYNRRAEEVVKAEATVLAVKRPLVQAYNEAFHRLSLLYPNRNSFIESFFMRTASAKTGSVPEAASATA